MTVVRNALAVYQKPVTNNLILAYDLIKPGQHYDLVRDAIRSLGPWYQLQYSLFFVQAPLTPEQAYDRVRAFMDAKDKLFIANATDAYMSVSYPTFDILCLQEAWKAA